jgi:hypothetical protein
MITESVELGTGDSKYSARTRAVSAAVLILLTVPLLVRLQGWGPGVSTWLRGTPSQEVLAGLGEPRDLRSISVLGRTVVPVGSLLYLQLDGGRYKTDLGVVPHEASTVQVVDTLDGAMIQGAWMTPNGDKGPATQAQEKHTVVLQAMLPGEGVVRVCRWDGPEPRPVEVFRISVVGSGPMTQAYRRPVGITGSRDLQGEESGVSSAASPTTHYDERLDDIFDLSSEVD